MSQEELRPLEQLRADIDAIDTELVRLLSDRADLARQIGRVKGDDGRPFFTPEREREIYQRLAEINPGPLTREQLQAIFREVISAARAAEQPLRVAYWGPPGTFSHRAALQTFGASVTLLPTDSITEAALAVDRGDADYAVAPVENSVGGVVPETLDLFAETRIRVCAETYVPVTHHLVSLAGSISEVRKVFAGPQPAAQCRKWLRGNLPGVEVVEVAPTSLAVANARQDPTAAAIANDLAAELQGMPILSERIQDHAANRTRFLILGFNEPAKTGQDKTTLLFNLRNRPGELHRALSAFVEHGVNLLMIESRPSPRGDFEYLFFADAEGHRLDDHVKAALEALRQNSLECVVLGSYPAASVTR